MRLTRITLLGATVAMLFSSCSDDDAMWPSVRSDMGWLSASATDGETYFLPDGGDTLTVTNNLPGLQPDTSYRVMASYTATSARATLTGLQYVMAATPKDYATEVTDPLDILSVWTGGGCVNLRLSVLTRNEATQFFGCIDRGLQTWPDGRHSLSLGLYHDQGDDPPSFSRTVYISFVLTPYEDILQAGDTVHVGISTFDEGEVVRSVILPG